MEVREETSPILASCLPVNVEFEDLSYSVRGGGESKKILKNVNGIFRSGELTAILGCSGSGKTTLLNILSGRTLGGITGQIKINGEPRQMKLFKKMNTYIMQENYLQSQLTAFELMLIAAALKLGNTFSKEEREVMAIEILDLLNLRKCFDTRTENLSGGEKKRLAIALEIVGNPPVIFLDEPMSGLDTVAIKQCMEVLRTLADQGRTVVLTVHQPSMPTFQKFNQVYFLADGMCIYNGSTTNMVPFLSSIGLSCPITYSPAEFVIELPEVDKQNLSPLVKATENGKINMRDSIKSIGPANDSFPASTQQIEFAASFLLQFKTLFCRMMLQIGRNRSKIGMQIFCYLIIGFTFGILGFGIGNNAELAMDNFKFYLFVSNVFMYMHLFPQALLFPFEVELLKREYFNRWYGLKPYFLALMLRNVPLTMIFELVFLLITYTMTDQPLEWERFSKFFLVCLLVTFASEALGVAVGSICSPIAGAIAAPAISIPCEFFALHGIGYGQQITYPWKILMHSSYIRLAVDSLHLATFEDRPKLDCTDEMVHCLYKDPKHVLRDLGILGHSYWLEVSGLVGFMVLFHLVAYFALRYRLSTEFAPKMENFITKILKYK